MSAPQDLPGINKRTLHLIVSDGVFQPLPELTEEEKTKYTELLNKMIQDLKDFKSDNDLLTGTKGES